MEKAALISEAVLTFKKPIVAMYKQGNFTNDCLMAFYRILKRMYTFF